MEDLELFYNGIDFMSDLFEEDYLSIIHIPEKAPDNYKAIFVLNRTNISESVLEELDTAYKDSNLKDIKPPEDKEEIDGWLQNQSFAYKFFVYMGMLSGATNDGLGFYEQENIESLSDEYKNLKCYVVIYDENWEVDPENFKEFEEFGI